MPAKEVYEEKVELSVCEIIKEELPLLKWRVLIFCCFLTFGSYYIYDFPGSIGTGPENTIQALFYEKGKEYTQAMNLALYSIYSWPNSVLAIFGGLLIDKYLGLRRAMLLFCALVTAGAGLFYVGVVTTNYPVMMTARLLFGLGGESLSVAQSAFVARWFKEGRGMALAFGITVSFSRVGSSFNFLFSPLVSKDVNVETGVLMGLVACGFSLVSCMALIWLDVIGTRRGQVPPEAKENATPFNLKEIRELPALLWIACGITVFSYCSIFPFVGIAENFFQVKFGSTHEAAGQYTSIYQFTSAGGSPVVGFLVDALGRFCYWIIAACAGFAGVHIIFVFTMAPPALMMVILGIMYSLLVSSLWPSIPYCVEPAFVGFAYGVITALQNFGLAAFPLMTGFVLTKYTPANFVNTTNVTNHTATPAPMPTAGPNVTVAPHFQQLLNAVNGALFAEEHHNKTNPKLPTLTGYKWTEFIFILSAGVATLLAVLFLVIDARQHNGMLAASPTIREAKKKDLDAEHDQLINSEKSYKEV